MTLVGIELVRVTVPFRVDIGTAAGVHRTRPLLFVRLVTEDYFFVCRKHTLENESVQRLIGVMRSGEFAAAIAQLPGYAAKDPGVVKGIREGLHPFGPKGVGPRPELIEPSRNTNVPVA